MLERFHIVKKVGLFEDYTHSPGREFGEVTLIYGENGVGKSTLAAILDSLREHNGAEITRRRSLPGDVTPSVTIAINGALYVFNGDTWDGELPHDTLEVFFPGFVTRNVHAATGVDTDNQRHLCEFVLGRKAVEQVKRLAQADADGRTALTNLKKVERDLQLLIKKPDSLDTFLGYPKDDRIEEKIEAARSDLKQAQSREAILAKGVPRQVEMTGPDNTQIGKVLERSVEGIAADVADKVREYIKLQFDKHGERWLAYGAQHIGPDNKCPFCAQDLGGSQFFVAIQSYFSAAYRDFTESLGRDISGVRETLGPRVFAAMRTAFMAQIGVAAQWTSEFAIDQEAIGNTLSEAEAHWTEGSAALEAVIARKEAKPLEKVLANEASVSLTAFASALGLLKQVNDILSQSAKRVEERKKTLAKANTTALEERLNRFENQKLRFEPLAQDLLGKRLAALQLRSQLEEEKKTLKKQIDENAARVVGKYQAGINWYLEYFACDIRIDSVEPQFPSGRASVHYVLKAHGHEINLGVSEDEPSFETVLSEGDKYTLALSFFFARLKECSDLKGRIIVLDDPANSLGSSRRTLIEGVVRDLRKRGAQVVILTHDERFAAMIWRDRKLKDVVALQVERTGGGSALQPWDADRAMRSAYVEHYLTLSDYLKNGGDHDKAARCIRPYVEQRLRHMLPGPPFESRDSLGDMIGKIRNSTPGTRLYPLLPTLEALASINDAALPSHHATDDVPGMVPLTADGVRIFAQKALEV